MESLRRKDIPVQNLPGRRIQGGVGKDAPIASTQMAVGYATYSAESGKMEPHHHAEETILVLDAKDSFVRWGPAKDNLTESMALEKGMFLHFPDQEWHVFEYEEGGYLDIVFIYGQVNDLRPEQKNT